jgi:hypothetical protein
MALSLPPWNLSSTCPHLFLNPSSKFFTTVFTYYTFRIFCFLLCFLSFL